MKKIALRQPILAGVIEVSGIQVRPDDGAFRRLMECGHRYRESFAGQPISAIPGIQSARQLFRALGIEPTKHRPASEALLRRFLKGKEVYSINNVVDISNWCALDFLLSNGVYDRTKIVGDIELRRGLPGESYLGLNNLELHLEGRYTLADALGPFGSPKTDSQRTCIDLTTTEIIAIIYAPQDYEPAILQAQCDLFAQRITEHCGGTIDISRILSNQSQS